MMKLCTTLVVVAVGIAVATSSASARLVAAPTRGCFIVGVIVQHATIHGQLYVNIRAPSNCGAGVEPLTQQWKIVIRDAHGLHTIYRSRGSAVGNIRIAGSVATIWAKFTIRHGSRSATRTTTATIG